MVRICSAGLVEQARTPYVRATRSRIRGRGQGGARDAARAPAKATMVDPPVAQESDHVEQLGPARAPEGPIATLGLQKTLAQFMIMFGILV